MTEQLIQFVTTEHFLHLFKAALLLIFGFFAAFFVSRLLYKLVDGSFSQHHAILFRRFVYWVILALFIASALKELGFSLSVLLGAAGIFSVALGFAAQTSVSNLISGLFLIGEKSFELGDTIKVANTTGEVLSIDLLSVKLRTPNNLYVRIPNETLVKSEVTNLTRFPLRRLDIQLGVAYKEDMNIVRKVLLDVADNNPLSLDDPAPVFAFSGFGESSQNIQFSVWVTRENISKLQNSLLTDIKSAFDQAGIDIPFPCRTLYVAQTDQEKHKSSTN